MRDGITPFGQTRTTRPRAIFFAHDSQGLGHIRRVLALSGELARRRPETAMLAITSSFFGDAWPAPENLDLIKLPSLSRRDVYDDLTHSTARRRGGVTTFHALRERMIHEVATAFAPWLFVVDNEPVGLQASKELVRTLEDLRAGPAGTRLVLGLRDIYEDSDWIRTSWPRQGITRILAEVYDQILVYGDQSVFDVAREYRLPPAAAEKIVYTGYIRKREPLVAAEALRASLAPDGRPLVVVTTGSGFDGASRVHAYVTALAGGYLPGVASFIVAGPLMEERERAALQAASRLPATRFELFEDNLTSWINAADLVVSMAGYNTVTEALGYGKRLLVIPRIAPGEQLIRATRLAERGQLRMLHPHDLTPERLAREVLEALAEPPPGIDLDFGGLERAGELLAAGLR